jgi:branched-chain amino acid transport system ATP-binding protein
VPPPLLRVERLTRHFAGLAALQDVSFELDAGGICGLIGPNGAGKTTLLAVLAGALRPTSGKVIFGGRDLAGLPAFAVVRTGIVRTHQVPKPFRSLSVLENVEVGARFGRAGGERGGAGGSGMAAARPGETALRVLERVGLAHRAGTPAGTLSVGDQKRLELARGLAARPQLLLCDEVCSGLTTAETAAVLALLREIRDAGTTILYVEHDLKAIMAVCDRVLVMNLGRMLADGTPTEVQADEAVITAYIGAKGARRGEGGDGTEGAAGGNGKVAG